MRQSVFARAVNNIRRPYTLQICNLFLPEDRCFCLTSMRCYQYLDTPIKAGRSVPICWASCKKHVYDGHRSRNAFEESLLLVFGNARTSIISFGVS